ncbi:hypothetical protein MHF_0654 [Mycoplasma haemofelis Ohio2]|uniref:Uncharacterized protein n=1 Tax=Mycoplasma haemofelis (strain Ohio2) TaxID=859194 RepID=F6FI78_MYCHI|nr:hypothetical protein MHF_0654 [Mycoplasma haemofelis Ohio2]
MSISLTKAGLSLAGVGGAGIGGYAIASYSGGDSKTIKEILTEEGYSVLTATSDWEKVAKTYSLEVTSDLKIADSVNAEVLKQWCGDKLKSTDKDSFLKKAKKWCTSYSTIQDQLSKDKLTLETSEDTLKSKYSGLEGSIKTEVDSLNADSGKDVGGSKLKKWCESRSYKTYLAGEFYNTFKDKCTKSVGAGG